MNYYMRGSTVYRSYREVPNGVFWHRSLNDRSAVWESRLVDYVGELSRVSAVWVLLKVGSLPL